MTDLATLAARVAPEGDVLVVEESVKVLDELRGRTPAPNVFYLLGCAEVLPLMDGSVDEVSAPEVATAETAEEFFRVLRAGGRLSLAGPNESALNSTRMVTEAGFVEVSAERGGGGPLSARKP